MSAELKKINNYRLDTADKEDKVTTETTRPNIDHLIKRINTERRKEKLNNLTYTTLGIVILIIMSIYFTQT
jgi:hypothetical protein|tara:strand:+ start:2877 stop:3089 length:213 start_codon:yes stop_codon:yes gene_type:complete